MPGRGNGEKDNAERDHSVRVGRLEDYELGEPEYRKTFRPGAIIEVDDVRDFAAPAPAPRVYIAGPMTGYPEFNFPAFAVAAAALRKAGVQPVNPAINGWGNGDPNTGALEDGERRAFYREALKLLVTCDELVLLPGWQESTGAQLERHVAEALGMPVRLFLTFGPGSDEWTLVGTIEEDESNNRKVTDRHPNSKRFHDLLLEMGELHDRKQADYGRGSDPFANVRASSEWGIEGWVGAMVRLTDKVRRLQSLAQKGYLANEAAVDSFMDIAVYAVIARVLFEEEMPV